MSEHDIFRSARWYEKGINWDARIAREIPVLRDLFGPPGAHGILDAACGPGWQMLALTEAGYRMIGLDASAEMLALAKENVAARGADATLIEARFDEMPADCGPFDGVYCIGNSLAATGSAEAGASALRALGQALTPGGLLFIQILNFEKLRQENPRVRGPRVRQEGDIEYVSNRVFAFHDNRVDVVNVIAWKESGTWRQHSTSGTIYAISLAEMREWCAACGLNIEAEWGAYDRHAFDLENSNDLIIVARRME